MTQKVTSVVIWRVRGYLPPDYPGQNPGTSPDLLLSPPTPEARGDGKTQNGLSSPLGQAPATESSVAWLQWHCHLPFLLPHQPPVMGQQCPQTALPGSLAMRRGFGRVLSATSPQPHMTVTPLLPEPWGTDPCSSLPLPTTAHGQVPGLATFLSSATT